MTVLLQTDLEKYLQIKQARLELERQARELGKYETTMETTIRHALENGAMVETGPYTAEVVDGGRYPSWKKAFLEYCGEEMTQAVIDETPCKKVLKVEAIMPALNVLNT